MYFPDLTPYCYGRTEPQQDILNVGWLSNAHPFERGTPDARLVSALERLIACPVNLYRGKHLCEFCPEPPIILRNGMRFIDPKPGTEGNGEIRVTGEGAITYVAPVLVAHYVSIHGYVPPKQFVQAVLKAVSD
ncbi:MAG: hypothetical protein ACLPX9_04460 [Rhodomicrobium sp.]